VGSADAAVVVGEDHDVASGKSAWAGSSRAAGNPVTRAVVASNLPGRRRTPVYYRVGPDRLDML
jgi:hypothetical protein